MKHIFPKAGEELTSDVNFFAGKNSGSAFYQTDYYNNSGSIRGSELENVISTGNNQFLTIQTDFKNPFTEKTKLETGLRAQIRQFANTNGIYLQDTISTAYKYIPSAGSNYKDNDYIYADYASLTSTTGNFGYQAGLRLESSNYTGEIINVAKLHHNYPVSLFPSLFLSEKLPNKQELQLSYTRRINRPNFFNMIPYTDRTNKLNVIVGNPDLIPEFTNSLEVSYSKTFKGNNNLLGSLYYKHTSNLITTYLTDQFDPYSGGQIITYINANSSYSYGAELTSVNYFTKWWDVTSNINLYNSRINTANISKTISQSAILSWFGKINNNFKLPKNFTVQLSGNYQSKTNLPVNQNQQNFGPPQQAQSASQGYIRAFYSVDAAVKKSFLKNNAGAFTLSFSDLFRTRKQDLHAESSFFIQDYIRINNPQMIRLTFSYRFGKMDMSLFKRKNMNNNGMNGATDGMGQ